MRYISWTSFNQPRRVAILTVHGSKEAGVKSIKRWRKIYPEIKLIEEPQNTTITYSGNSEVKHPKDIDIFENAPVILAGADLD